MRQIIIFIAASLFTLSSALACSRPPADDVLFERAAEVFVARIVETELQPFSRKECDRELVDSDSCNFVIGHFELVEALKGTPPRRGKVREFIFTPGACSLGLVAGWYYVFYATAKERMVLYTDGSFPLGWSYDEKAKEVVQHLREQGHPRPKDDP